MTPHDVSDELAELGRRAMVTYVLATESTSHPTYIDKSRAVLAAVLPEYEKLIREQIAQELIAIDGFEWALAGQRAGLDAAKIARGEK